MYFIVKSIIVNIFTARVRNTREGTFFTGVCPHLRGGGYPSQVRSQDRGGGGTLYWNSIVCTCYAAGGMPLAFTQEYFLVIC